MAVAQNELSNVDNQQILDALDDWLNDIKPMVKHFDHNDEYPSEIVSQMKELGLFCLMYPVEYGGMGMNASSYAKVISRLSETWMSLAGIINTHMMLGQLILRFGTDGQKKLFLRRLASAELHGVLCLTEPDAGTDLQGIKTTAIQDGNDYLINGSKMWITNGQHGSLYALLTKNSMKLCASQTSQKLLLLPVCSEA